MHIPVLSYLSIAFLAAVAASGNVSTPANGYRSVGYYAAWASGAPREFYPQNLSVETLTHVLYAFADLVPTTGEVVLWEPEKDVGSKDMSANDLGGSLNQLYSLKKGNRKLKVLLSIGGWTLSSNFTGGASTKERRKTFATTAVKLVTDLGLDGLDIDWEYPTNETEADNLVDLLCEVRSALKCSSQNGTGEAEYLLTVAAPAGPTYYEKLKIREMDQFLDFWNIMAYDFAGGWSQTTGHLANLFPSTQNPESTKVSADTAINYYVTQGVRKDKLVLGMPVYGRSFLNTDGPGKPYSGIAPSGWAWSTGNWEAGVWDYKALPRKGEGWTQFVKAFDIVASYSYDEAERTMISYDTKDIAARKAQYIKDNGLGGAMFWETSGDKAGNDSLIGTVVKTFGGTSALDQTLNRVSYPQSRYQNVRKA